MLVGFGWKPAMTCPFASERRTKRRMVFPLTELNEPPTKTDRPSGPGASASTSLLSCGTKLGSIMPVFMSNAKMRLRVSVTADPDACTCVNVPPTMTLLPICTTASTCPSRMLGVQLAGLSETTAVWVVSTAPPGG